MNQFFRFIVVGLSNSLLGYSIIFACMYLVGLSPEVSNIIGYGLALIISYILSRNYTFRSKQRHSGEIVRFLLVFSFAYASNFAVLLILLHEMDIQKGVSQILASIVYVVVSYLMNKYYVFRPPSA